MRRLAAATMILSLLSLTGCFPASGRQVIRTEYVRQQVPPLPASPDYYQPRFRAVGNDYCVDADGARELLKNRVLDRAYQEELTGILATLQGGEGR